MAKTELTLRIEELLYSYDPETTGGCNINKFRGRHIGYEVPVSTGTISEGLVDCVRVDEILINGKKSRACTIGRNPNWYKKNHPFVLNYVKCNKGITNIDDFPEYCEETSCATNCLLRHFDNEICVTCYEIKISKDDFHSNHGHNFCGNANYYVMPSELYTVVKDEIPEDIGVIVYRKTDKQEGLRRVKECTYKQLDAETHRWMLLNVMKKKFNYRAYNELVDTVKYLYDMIERSCATCDFRAYCETNNDKKQCCNIFTKNPEHSCLWECRDSVLQRCGILGKQTLFS